MSSVKIIKAPIGGDVPDEVAEDMVGLIIGLTGTPELYGLGFKPKSRRPLEIEEHVEVQVDAIIHAAKYRNEGQRRDKVIGWFEENFPHYASTANVHFFSIGPEHGEYQP